MPMKLSRSTVIDRPPAVVWQFIATDHLQNHPRWDPKMELRQITEGPIGVGTRIQRRHTRLGAPIEGTMEIVEFQPPLAMGGVIHDSTPTGELEVHSRMTMEPERDGRTRVTINLDIPAMTASMDPSMIDASLAKMKELIEAET
ncbi:MAG TPA: SRPBCC family protein [Candidatus Limnocylindria bacterium]|nr:SRPBCC family protein [Candidatus Limnocylindria bacterium]